MHLYALILAHMQQNETLNKVQSSLESLTDHLEDCHVLLAEELMKLGAL